MPNRSYSQDYVLTVLGYSITCLQGLNRSDMNHAGGQTQFNYILFCFQLRGTVLYSDHSIVHQLISVIVYAFILKSYLSNDTTPLFQLNLNESL